MVVTHLFQILAFVAMEAADVAGAGADQRGEEQSLSQPAAIEPGNVVRGQYAGYRSEPGVDPESDIETFIALKCDIDNWRWAGVPFFLRTGKRLAEVKDYFSRLPRAAQEHVSRRSGVGAQGPDHLTFDLADASNCPCRSMASTWSGHAAGQVEHAICHARYRLDRRRPRGLRAPDPGCDARRPHSVQHRRRHRAAVGSVDPAAGIAAARPALPAGFMGTDVDPPARRPHAWRLPFERAWRDPNQAGA